jgi:hypothetical protein
MKIAMLVVTAATDLRVTPPDTTETVTVPIHFDTCPPEVHPVNATP